MYLKPPDYHFVQKPSTVRLNALISTSFLRRRDPNVTLDPESLKKCDSWTIHFARNDAKKNFSLSGKKNFEAEGICKAHNIVLKQKRNKGKKDLHKQKLELYTFLMDPEPKSHFSPARHMDKRLIEKFHTRSMSISKINAHKGDLPKKHKTHVESKHSLGHKKREGIMSDPSSPKSPGSTGSDFTYILASNLSQKPSYQGHRFAGREGNPKDTMPINKISPFPESEPTTRLAEKNPPFHLGNPKNNSNPPPTKPSLTQNPNSNIVSHPKFQMQIHDTTTNPFPQPSSRPLPSTPKDSLGNL